MTGSYVIRTYFFQLRCPPTFAQPSHLTTLFGWLVISDSYLSKLATPTSSAKRSHEQHRSGQHATAHATGPTWPWGSILDHHPGIITKPWFEILGMNMQAFASKSKAPWSVELWRFRLWFCYCTWFCHVWGYVTQILLVVSNDKWKLQKARCSFHKEGNSMQSTSCLTRSDGFLSLLLLLLLLPGPWQLASVTHARVNPMRVGNTCALRHTHAQMELLFMQVMSVYLTTVHPCCLLQRPYLSRHISSYSSHCFKSIFLNHFVSSVSLWFTL